MISQPVEDLTSMKFKRNKLSRIVFICLNGMFIPELVDAKSLQDAEYVFTDNQPDSEMQNNSVIVNNVPGFISSNGKFYTSSTHKLINNVIRTETYVSDLDSGILKKTRLHGISKDSEVISSSVSDDGKVISGFATAFSPSLLTDVVNAVIWHGNDWSTLKVLTNPVEKTAWSFATSLSGDGRVAGGFYRKDTAGLIFATIWSGEDWNDISFPASGTFNSKALTASEVSTFSRDGSVAAGTSRFTDGDIILPYLTIWSGDKWQHAIYPEQESATASDLSADGKVLAGTINVNSPETTELVFNTRAAVYHGIDWSNKTMLKSIGGQDHNFSRVNSLSSDGTIAVGHSAGNNGLARATLWSGPEWSTITDLGRYLPENTYFSTVKSLAGDASVALGSVKEKESSGPEKLILWKLKWDKPVSEIKVNDATNNQPISAVMIDADETQKTISKLSSDVINVLQLQYLSLKRLSDFCNPDLDKACWTFKTGYNAWDSMKEINTGFSVSSSITPSIDAGFSLDQSLTRSLPESFNHSELNRGAGFFIKYHQKTSEGDWFVMPAVAFNRVKTDVTRHKLKDTESGTGNADIRGLSYSIVAGKNYRTVDEKEMGWYTGMRRDEIKMDGWNEGSNEFPMHWDKTSYKRTDLLIGLKTTVPLMSKLSWINSAEISQRISGGHIRTAAQNKWLGNFNHEISTAKNMWNVSSGLRYQLNDDIQISAIPSVWKTSRDTTSLGISFGIGGQF